jgi:hypothetical protein
VSSAMPNLYGLVAVVWRVMRHPSSTDLWSSPVWTHDEKVMQGRQGAVNLLDHERGTAEWCLIGAILRR